jgi:hypothetical protein
MSFAVSNKIAGNFITALSGANGIATQSSYNWSDVNNPVGTNVSAFYKASSGYVWVGVDNDIKVYSDLTFTNLLYTFGLDASSGVKVFHEAQGFMYAGGQFAGVTGQTTPQYSLLRFSGANVAAAPVFDPMFSSSATGMNGISGVIYAITSSSTTLYIGGHFDTTFIVPSSLYNLCIIGNPYGASGNQTYTADTQGGVVNFSTGSTINETVYALYYHNNSGVENVYVGGNFTTVAEGYQLIPYGAVYEVGWTTVPFTTLGVGGFNAPISSFSKAVDGASLLFTGSFNFNEAGQAIKYGGYSELANNLNPVKSFNIASISQSTSSNCIGVNASGYNFFITDNRQVWYGTDSNSWKDGGVAWSSGTPTGILYDTATAYPYVAMPTSLSGVRQGSPLSYSYLYYSINYGANWSSNGSGSVPDVTFSSISLDLLSGQNGVAAGINNTSLNPVVYFTSDGGLNWSASTGLPSIATSSIHVSIFDSNALVGINSPTTVSPSFSEYIVYYSTNGGSSWTIWNISPSAIKGQAANVAVSSSSMIVLTTDNETNAGPVGNTKIYRSINNGSLFTLSVVLSFVLTNSSFSSSGGNSVACGQSGVGSTNGYILWSSDNGGNWASQQWGSPTLIDNNTKVVSIDGSVAMIGGINGTTAFIWYSTNGGALWTDSGFVLANVSSFTGISVSGNDGLASINTNTNTGYLYYSTDQGHNWTNAGGGTLSATTINDVSLSGAEGVAGTSNGIYYTISPLCYEANTLILILENEEEVYKKVSELKVGDLVKTYKQGYKKIKLFRSFKYKPLDINNDLNLLYKHKENGVVVTGGHSILVDELTEQEKVNNLKHYGFNQTIEDKKLLLACSSDKFEKIDDYREEYHLCHFSLESDNPKEHFGVYITDGILSESCPEDALLKML